MERGPGRGLTSSIFWVSFKYYQKNQSLDSFPLPIVNFTWMLQLDAAPIASAIPAEMPGSREPLRPLPSGCHPTDPPWNPRGCQRSSSQVIKRRFSFYPLPEVTRPCDWLIPDRNRAARAHTMFRASRAHVSAANRLPLLTPSQWCLRPAPSPSRCLSSLFAVSFLHRPASLASRDSPPAFRGS